MRLERTKRIKIPANQVWPRIARLDANEFTTTNCLLIKVLVRATAISFFEVYRVHDVIDLLL
jgi:hypothetical protein